MVVTLLSNTGEILKGELTYDMLYVMLEKINIDLNDTLRHEKEELIKLFKQCQERGISAETAMITHTARITSYTNTALFYARQA